MELACKIQVHFGSALTSFNISSMVMGIFMFSSSSINFDHLCFIKKSFILPRLYNVEHRVQHNNLQNKTCKSLLYLWLFSIPFLAPYCLAFFFFPFSSLALQQVSLFSYVLKKYLWFLGKLTNFLFSNPLICSNLH